MSKMTWVKWGFVITGSTVAVLNLGGCFADFVLQMFVLTATN